MMKNKLLITFLLTLLALLHPFSPTPHPKLYKPKHKLLNNPLRACLIV